VLRIRTRKDIVRGTLLVTLLAVSLVALHVEVNYPADMRDVVRVRALGITVCVTSVISFYCFVQLRKVFQLTLELQSLVDRDRLTNIATRDFFFRRMQAMPQQIGVSLMADIDHFKQINDTYGHMAGDKVIQEVARILKANIRESDIVCRFGGEEFVIFLGGLSAQDGFVVAERMRQQVASAQVTDGQNRIAVSISIGGAGAQRAAAIEQAIRAADAALYRAKLGGRNRTVFQDLPVKDAIAVSS
jgi:diguanylate cyclase (GGDEF)-like protein